MIAAAAAGDAGGMWATLSDATKHRLGPTPAAFRAHSFRSLAVQLAPFAHGSRVFLEELTEPNLAVAAVSTRKGTGSGRRLLAYAAVFRHEGNAWLALLDPSIRIRSTLPPPGGRIFQRTKVLAEIAAPAPIAVAALWFDGLAASAEAAGADPRHAGVLAEAPQPLHDGWHTVVTFATAGASAAARAWTFPSHGGPYTGN
jgi:hypothetical protein